MCGVCGGSRGVWGVFVCIGVGWGCGGRGCFLSSNY